MATLALFLPTYRPIGQARKDVAAVGRRQYVESGAGRRGVLLGAAAGVGQGAGLAQRREQGLARALGIAQEGAEDDRIGRGQAFEGVDQGQREFLLGEVGAERFAGRFLEAYQVQQVVGDLERDAQAAAELGETLDDFAVSPSVKCAEPAATRGELRGLAIDDVEVILFREGEVAAFGDLVQLALADAVGGSTDEGAGPGVDAAREMEGVREEHVAEQDARLISPTRVDRADMAAERG